MPTPHTAVQAVAPRAGPEAGQAAEGQVPPLPVTAVQAAAPRARPDAALVTGGQEATPPVSAVQADASQAGPDAGTIAGGQRTPPPASAVQAVASQACPDTVQAAGGGVVTSAGAVNRILRGAGPQASVGSPARGDPARQDPASVGPVIARLLMSGMDSLFSTESPAHARGDPVLAEGRPVQAAQVDNVLTLSRLKTVAFKGGTIIIHIISFALTAVMLGCVLTLAVAPLLNIWHTPGSGQHLCWPASFDWSDTLRLAHRLPPLSAPTITSPSNLHGGFMLSTGGLESAYLRGAVESSYWVFGKGGLRPVTLTSGWPGLAWWTWFRWYRGCIQSWGALCRG